MGGGGSQRQETTTQQQVPPGLQRAYNAAGGVAENMAEGLDYMPGLLQDDTVQEIAGMTDIGLAAQDEAMNLLQGQGPEAWGQASDFMNEAGNMQQFESQDYNLEGDIRDIDSFDMQGWMDNMPGGGGGGGGGGFSFSSGGAPYSAAEAIGNPLESMDFANHPALQSALDTFAKTALPGIENQMIGAGLGRSGAAANAISTGKATMALPMITELIRGELANKGMDVTQRGQDYQAQAAAANASASGRSQAAGYANQRYMAGLQHAQAMRAQDIQLRGQDIGMNQQQIDAMIAEDQQNFAGQQQQQNSLLGAGTGLTNLGQAQSDYAQENIEGAMGMDAASRAITDRQNEAQFNADMRSWERGSQVQDQLLSGAQANAGQTSTTTTTGGGGK